MTNQSNKTYDIKDRTLEFAAKVAIFINRLNHSQASLEYSKQVIRASASIGANIEEADGTLSNKDFINKMAIGRREARESRYWLRLIAKANLVSNNDAKKELEWLINESEEIMLILSSIINKSKAKIKI